MDGDFRRQPPRIEPAHAAKGGDELRLEPETPVSESSKLKPCPSCARLIPGDSKKCLYCGEGAAQLPPGPDSKPLPCAFCQYDMRGAPSILCPECGKKQPRGNRRARDELLAKDLDRADIKKSLIFIAVGVAITIAFSLYWTKSFAGVPAALIAFASYLFVGNVVYFALGAIWLGLEGGTLLIAMRVSAAVAVAHVAFILAVWLLGGACFFIAPLVPIVLYASTLWDLFDHDVQDSFIVSLLTHVAFVATYLTLAQFL